MQWRIEDDRRVGAKATKVCVLTLDGDELEHLAKCYADNVAFNGGDTLVEIDLSAARLGLIKAEAEARRVRR